MFKPLLHLMITAAIVMFASPVIAACVTYQLSVTVPPHTMVSAGMTEQKQAIVNNVPVITQQQVIQQEQITRNDQTVTIQSVVVL